MKTVLAGVLLALPIAFGIAHAAPAPTPAPPKAPPAAPAKPDAGKAPAARAPTPPAKAPTAPAAPGKPPEKQPDTKGPAADAVFPYQLPAGFKREDLKKLKGAGWAQCDKIAEGLADACQLDGTYWQLDLGRFSTNLVELRFFQNVLWGVTIKKRDLLECGETQGAFYDAVNALKARYPKAEPITGTAFGSKECGDLDRPDATFWQIVVGQMRVRVEVKHDVDAYDVFIDYKHKKLAEQLDLAVEKARSEKRAKGVQKL